jgi:predicted acylesterase/phospholipase RssA/CRP-like cAMP-binding protein
MAARRLLADFVPRRWPVSLQPIVASPEWSPQASLRASQLFAGLDSTVLDDVEDCVEILTLASGDALFRQGDPGDALFVILSGRVRILVETGDGRMVRVAELGRGETVGEMAVISGEARSATVVAIRDSHLARLSRERFERLLVLHPVAITGAFSGKLVARLRNETSGAPRRGGRVRTFAVEGLSPDVALDEFCARFAAALERFGRVVHLTGRRVDAMLGRSGIAQTDEGAEEPALVERLCRLEQHHDFVLYQADAVVTGWTRRCRRQADFVLRVGNGGGEPPVTGVTRELAPPNDPLSETRYALVLQHPAETDRPAGTMRWLVATGARRHFHVRAGDQDTYDRMSRILVGRAVGLTLGGGFARGIAHAGVMRALDEAGVEIDLVGGASMGAVIGAQRALGWDVETIVRRTARLCSDSFSDLTLPFVAFHRGRKFSRAIADMVGDIQIEDLWVPFFCVSANLNRSELRIHERGSLAKALLASTRAPGLFPPIVYDGDLHVDGGVINNVPIDVMINFANQGIVVGVDVSPPHELTTIADYGVEVDGWRALWRRFTPFARSRAYMPSILLILMRTLEFGGVTLKQSLSQRADLYLRPPLLAFKRTDFALADRIAAVGYEHAVGEIRRWLATPLGDRGPCLRQPDDATAVDRAPEYLEVPA